MIFEPIELKGSLLKNGSSLTVEVTQLEAGACVVQVLRDGTEQPYYADVRGNFLVDADVATEYEVRGEQAMTLRVKRRPD